MAHDMRRTHILNLFQKKKKEHTILLIYNQLIIYFRGFISWCFFCKSIGSKHFGLEMQAIY